MSEITDWIKNELYPSLFESIDRAFPEHNFTRNSTGWISNTYLKDGSPHKSRKDKTVISRKAQGFILENGGETLSLVDYTMRRDGVEFIEAVKTLAAVAGRELPQSQNYDSTNYQRHRDQTTLLEACNGYFMYCLENAPGAEEVRAYLSSRGYSVEDCKAMELGFIPSQEKLSSYLRDKKGYSPDLIAETVKLTPAIGDTHKLILPFRSGGSIKGFVARTLSPEQKSKYMYSTGLVRSETFYNIKAAKNDKDIVIVEGCLDALICDVRGIENVVALGGANLSSQQIEDAIKRGAKKFTLCLDKDTAGENGTLKAIEVILAAGVSKIYIATLPELNGVKADPDQLIKEKGAESFKAVIAEAVPYYEYKLQTILHKYGKIQEESGGELSAKQIDSFLEEVVVTGSKLEPLHKDQLIKTFTSLEVIIELGITEESVSITVERLASKRKWEESFRRSEARREELNKVLSEAKRLNNDYDEYDGRGKALKLLESTVKEVDEVNSSSEFSKLLIPTSEAQMREEESSLPDSLDSGYKIKGEVIELPSGAITVVAAPTNHGKTAMLINTALNVATKNPEKRFIFFTYEERANSIIQYFLNTFMDRELNKAERGNRKLLKEYFKTGSTQFISNENLEYFQTKKAEFFKTYIDSGRIVVRYVDYNSSELTSAIRYLHKEAGNIGGIFIDYFQLLKLPTGKYKNYGSRQEELKQICIALKDVAVDTGLPLILAAQFNREVTNLMRLHPTNIGEAGDIERIVNTLIGLWNLHKKPVLKGITEAEADVINQRTNGVEKGMYLEILKARDLPTGAYEILDYNGNTGKIANREATGYDFF